ncbi:hypothetical protein [Neobacillus terrae]|uniref:hypothetical protein n=1 Tax=Neobacillus terrae TaxID=3034837 RepID=UPI001408B1AA|nr:hypothetical protein [Neobacillus terrae]NHM33812.1 hypothetical protein [Neobacillus terrae]
MDSLEIVRKFYDETVNYEWQRLDRHKVEFELSKRYIKRYVKQIPTYWTSVEDQVSIHFILLNRVAM